MAPAGLAILIGAGPAAGAGIARILAHPSHGNLAVALLARRPQALDELATNSRKQTEGGVFETFPTDTSPDKLRQAFADIKAHQSAKKPFMSETIDDFMDPLQTYVGGAMVFAQRIHQADVRAQTARQPWPRAARRKARSSSPAPSPLQRRVRELRCFARLSVRQLAQALAREMSAKGVHVAHTIANGRITDDDGEGTKSGKSMHAEAVGKTYLWLAQQEPTLWTHELDLRPAQEKF